MKKMRNPFKRLKQRYQELMHNEALKQKLYIIIFEADTFWGKAFDVALIGCILLSVLIVILESLNSIPPQFSFALEILEYVFTAFFTFEYVVRLYCSPKPKQYVFSFFGMVDLLATLPVYLSFFLPGSRYFLIIRTFRLIRVFRVFKLFSFLAEGNLLLRSLRQSFNKILVFFFFVVIMVVSIGTLMYMIEGDQEGTSFNNIPNSIYWAIVTMTTVGYGDITPVTGIGRFLSAVVMLLGYTIIAVPTGIVSASMIDEGNKRKSKRVCPHCGRKGHDESASFCKYCGQSLTDKK
jgi:voltage-gated potassium channel